MHQKLTMKKRKNNFGRNMICGVAVSLLTMVVCIAIFAALIQSETITVGWCGYCVVGIHLMSIIIGVCVALKGEKGNALWISLMLALIYYTVLIVMTAIVFGGQYQGITVTAFVILTGCVMPVIMGKWHLNVGKGHRNRKRSC